MINFNLPPYKWRENMTVLIENVSLDRIVISGSNSISFEFINVCDGDAEKNLICGNVWKLSQEYIPEIEEDPHSFPIFIGSVRAICFHDSTEVKATFGYLGYRFDTLPILDEYYFVCIDSGEVCIELICGKLSLVEPDGTPCMW